MDIYDQGVNLWYKPDCPPCQLHQFRGHLNIPAQDIIRCLAYFHEETSSGMIIYLTPVFASILHNILNCHNEYKQYFDPTDKVNSFNVVSVLLEKVDPGRIAQIQQIFATLSSRSPFGSLLSLIDFQTACIFLKTCFSPPPNTTSNGDSPTRGCQTQQTGIDAVPDEDDVQLVGEEQPECYKCPYSLKIMKDPVQNIICGHNYDRQSIFHYMCTSKKGMPLCPVLGCANKTPLSISDLVQNDLLRTKILQQMELTT